MKNKIGCSIAFGIFLLACIVGLFLWLQTIFGTDIAIIMLLVSIIIVIIMALGSKLLIGK
jgi:hypothetical protein